MTSIKSSDGGEVQFDLNNLYREDTFTDLKVGTLKQLVPVTSKGEPDSKRVTIYVGQSTVFSEAGPLPVDCKIDAKTIEEALEKFPAAIGEAIERLVEEVRALQRQAQSRIVTPDQAPPPSKLLLR